MPLDARASRKPRCLYSVSTVIVFVVQDGRTALLAACAEGHGEAVKALLAAGAQKEAAGKVGRPWAGATHSLWSALGLWWGIYNAVFVELPASVSTLSAKK